MGRQPHKQFASHFRYIALVQWLIIVVLLSPVNGWGSFVY